MDVAISRIAESSKINKRITSDAISILFSSTDENEPTSPCNHSEQGCDWIGTAASRKVHRCPFETVSCPSKGCTMLKIRRELQDHINFFCRFSLMTCPMCGIKKQSTVLFSSHLEMSCKKFMKYMKKTIQVVDTKTKQVKEENETWIFSFISMKHLERAFAMSHKHCARLVNTQACIRIAQAKVIFEAAMRKIDNKREKGLHDVNEEKEQEQEQQQEQQEQDTKEHKETSETQVVMQGEGNPFNWHIDKLLDFVEENGIRRANKRKKQAEIVKNFIKRKIMMEYKIESTKVTKEYEQVTSSWKERIKKSKWTVDSRLAQAKLNFSRSKSK